MINKIITKIKIISVKVLTHQLEMNQDPQCCKANKGQNVLSKFGGSVFYCPMSLPSLMRA